MTESVSLSAFPARVLQPDGERKNQAALLDLAKQRATDPKVFDDFTPVFFTARISTGQRDSYFTVMRPSTLRNYAAAAKEGVPFQDSHNTRSLAHTLGRSLDGQYHTGGQDGTANVTADFYVLREISPLAETFANQLRAGMAQDVSVGFHGGQWNCSICGRDMMTDWDCMHWPGVQYAVDVQQGDKTVKEQRVCEALIENANLSEVSTVYDGATPGAMILRAQDHAEAGLIKPQTARFLEQQLRIHLPQVQPRYAGVALPAPSREEPMPEEKKDAPTLGDATVQLTIDSEPVQRWLKDFRRELGVADDADIAAEFRKARDENTRLQPLAEDGKRYRADCIKDAVASRARLRGQEFTEQAEERYRKLLANADIDTIRQMHDDDEAAIQARGLFTPGRKTVDTIETPSEDRGPKTFDDPATYRA